MTKTLRFTVCALLFMAIGTVTAQEPVGPSSTGMLEDPVLVPSIAEQIRNNTAVYAESIAPHSARPKLRHGNKAVPGKGFPKGNDPLLGVQEAAERISVRAPNLVFAADNTPQAPVTDPTGAAGPNHYIAAWNFGFRIFDKSGNPLTPEMALSTLFPGNNIGDPIVFFDANVDNGPGEPRGRFVVTEFDNAPNGFNVAVSGGPDPVNDPWFVYTTGFGTGEFPDYTKFSIWGDAYVVTANIDNGPTGDRVFAVERNQMLQNLPAQFIGFPLPGIVASGFYSPQAFNTTADQTVPSGTPAPIIFMQDDGFAGTSADHLQIWEATIDFANPGNSSIVTAQELFSADGVSPFTGIFDGGSFSNRPQGGGPDIDVLQNTVMNQVQYRRFGTHNSVVLNFVVDVLGGAPELAAVRWYELRQTADGMPWTVFQEGTYTAPDGRDAYSASMAMNSLGDIAMAYTSSSLTDRISIRYTGQINSGPDGPAGVGVMNAGEQLIAQSTAANPDERLADYVHLTNDPADDSFWHIAEYFDPQDIDVVANFTLEAPEPNDIGVSSIDTPVDGVLSDAEVITVSIRNFGSNDIIDPMVQYSVDGGTPVVEQFNGTIAVGGTESFSFAQTANLSIDGQTYEITATTLLDNDSNTDNDSTTINVTNMISVCIPNSDCTFPDGVTVIQLVDQDITTDCDATDGHSDQTDIIFTFDPSLDSHDGIIQLAFGNSNYAIFIDFNDDGIFDANELLIQGVSGPANTDVPITLGVSGFTVAERLGSHLMRVRGADQNNGPGDATDPCGDLMFGRTNDFTAFFDEVLNVDETAFDDADFTIIERQENIFDISLRTAFDGNGAISVYNVIGQQVVFNNLDKEGDAFNYQLDMSYAATGVYIVQFGDVNGGSVVNRKIVVR